MILINDIDNKYSTPAKDLYIATDIVKNLTLNNKAYQNF